MIWLLGGYMWLFVHRPFEVWPGLGALQIERGYMFVMLLAWLLADKGGLPNRIHVALTFFTLVLAVGWALSDYSQAPGVSDVVENYFKVAVFYVMVVTCVRDERSLRLLLLMFLGAVGLYMAHSFLEFTRGRIQWRQGISRMVGVDVTFSDPNAFATTLLYALPLTLPFWYERPRRVPRALLLGFTFLACTCILLTGSRAAMVGLLAFGAMVLWVSFRNKGTLIVFGSIAFAFAFAVLTVALPGELQDRYLTLVDSSKGPANAQQSAEGRLDGFMYGIAAWQKSPLFGHGPATFAYSTGRGGGAHNLYGQVLSEAGLLGALALLALLACFTYNWLETRRLYRELHLRLAPDGKPHDLPYHVCRAIFMNVLLLLLMGWAGHNLYRYNWQWFAAFQAIALHCVRLRAEHARRAAAYARSHVLVPRPRPPQRSSAPAARRMSPPRRPL
jgi:O-antigen ligase